MNKSLNNHDMLRRKTKRNKLSTDDQQNSLRSTLFITFLENEQINDVEIASRIIHIRIKEYDQEDIDTICRVV
jgi:hypothetical protein